MTAVTLQAPHSQFPNADNVMWTTCRLNDTSKTRQNVYGIRPRQWNYTEAQAKKTIIFRLLRFYVGLSQEKNAGMLVSGALFYQISLWINQQGKRHHDRLP